MPVSRSNNPELVTIAFGDVVEFARLDSLESGKTPTARAASFVITELITNEDEHLLSAAKIMDGHNPERLSRFGTMDLPVRKVGIEPWDIGRIAAAIAWQFPTGDHVEAVRMTLETHAAAQPVEYPTF